LLIIAKINEGIYTKVFTALSCKVGIAHHYLKCPLPKLLRAMPTLRFVV